VNIYVGNLPYNTTEADLREAFGEFGTVTSASVVIDRETGRSRGFGFVEMATDAEGHKALEGMNGRDWNGRTLTVNEARPREQRPREDFANRGGGGGGFNRGPARPDFSSNDRGGGAGRSEPNGRGNDRGGRKEFTEQRHRDEFGNRRNDGGRRRQKDVDAWGDEDDDL
jgi:RNA recognition motif-containing protein